MTTAVYHPKTGTTIRWVEDRCQGKPLTRWWRGKSCIPSDKGQVIESKCGDTIESRDQEIKVLMTFLGWRVVLGTKDGNNC